MTTVPTVRVFEFHGDHLITFEHEGKPVVALRPVVEALGLDWSGQRHRLERDPVVGSTVVVTTTVAEDGKSREMKALPVDVLPLFLAKISVNRVKPELRDKLIRYQVECGKALYDYWFKGVAIRGDLDGVIQSISPEARQVLGGIMKAVVHRELIEIVPSLVAQEVASGRYGIVVGHMSVGQILETLAKTTGQRGLVTKASASLRQFCANRGIPPQTQRAGKAWCYVYPETAARDWFELHGRQLVAEHMRLKADRQKDLLYLVPPPKPA